MSIVHKNSFQDTYLLIDGILDEGLTFVVSYLEKMLSRPVMITNNNGRIHYPELMQIPGRMEDMFIDLPQTIGENEYYYKEDLYYPIQCNESDIYVIVKNLPTGMIPQAVSVLAEAKLALKCYFTRLDATNRHKEKVKKELPEHLFIKSKSSIRDILKRVELLLDIHKLYFIEMIEPDQAGGEVNWWSIYTFSQEYLKKAKSDIIAIAWPNCLMIIVSTRLNKDTLEIEQDWPRLINNYKEVIENQFNIVTSKGIGQIYPLEDLYRSYNEACIALTLPKLLKKKGFIQRFSDLGVFTLLFSLDTETIKNYCLKTLGNILEYDSKTNGELLTTLRILLDSSVNCKYTSDNLFIHVNTLYYRIERIEKLLNVDLSQMDTRLNLFTAIKAWDLLHIHNLLE